MHEGEEFSRKSFFFFFCEYEGKKVSKAEHESWGMVSLPVGKDAASVQIVRARQTPLRQEQEQS